MTRKSKRELERDLVGLETETDTSETVLVVNENPETGEWFADADDEEPVDPAVAEREDLLVLVIREIVVETDWDPETGINDTKVKTGD